MFACIALAMVVSFVVVCPDESDAATMSQADLQAMIDAGGTVLMTGDVVLEKDKPLVVNGNVILDMNGMTISVASDFLGKPLINNGTLTIKGEGIIDSTASSEADGAIMNNGTITIEDGMYKGNKIVRESPNELGMQYATTLINYVGGVMTINGGTFTGSNAALVNYSELIINGGAFTGNSCYNCDNSIAKYAVNNQTGDASMIINNAKVESTRGALGISAGYFEVNGGSFTVTKCESDHWSFHACYVAGERDEVDAHINGGHFSATTGYALYVGNSIPGDGGNMDHVDCYITGGVFESNNVLLIDEPVSSVEIAGGCFSKEITYTPIDGYELVEKDGKYYVTTPVVVDGGVMESETTSAYAELPNTKDIIVKVLNATISINGNDNLGDLRVSVNPRVFTAAPDATASYDIVIDCSTTYVMDVTVDAEIPDGHRVLTYYINGNELVPVEVLDYTSSTVTFRTDHNTPYVIMTEEIENESPGGGNVDEDDDFPFIPGNDSGSQSFSSDKTTLVAAAAAVVVIMLAVVALMMTRNH